MTGTPEGSTEHGFMEKPGIEPATPGLQDIGLSPTSRRLHLPLASMGESFQDYLGFSDIFTVYLKTSNHLKLKNINILKTYCKFKNMNFISLGFWKFERSPMHWLHDKTCYLRYFRTVLECS